MILTIVLSLLLGPRSALAALSLVASGCGEHLVELTVPLANYWHVKNYFRAEHPATGIVLTHPAPPESGIINYRAAIGDAITYGYQGAFVVEHYGGDGLSVGSTNRDYLRRILPTPATNSSIPHGRAAATINTASEGPGR